MSEAIAVPSPFKSLIDKIQELRQRSKLPNPGPFELLHKESRGVFLTNHAFEGGKVDLSKGLSQNFQISHGFHMGSGSTPSSYNFGTAFVGEKSFLHGTVDTDGSLSARINHQMTASFLTKVQTQLGNQPGQSMLQVEADYSGTDYTANLKAVNPSPFDNTGIFVASYLQSVTPSLAVGIEGLYQRPMEDVEETGLSFVAKYTFAKHELKTLQPLNPTDPIPQPPTANPVLTATLQSFGALQLTYFHPVSSKVELASELQVLAAPGRREAVASVGAKFDFRTATVRNMLDTTGKISTVLEQKMAPGFSFLISGEIDHLKGASRFGVGLALEM